MIIITNWNEINTSNISVGLKSDIKRFFKELVHDNMGEDHLTYDFTEIGKIAILESTDDINHLPEIGFYNETIFLLDSTIEFVEDVFIEDSNYYRLTILLNDAEGVVLYINRECKRQDIESWIQKERGE